MTKGFLFNPITILNQHTTDKKILDPIVTCYVDNGLSISLFELLMKNENPFWVR